MGLKVCVLGAAKSGHATLNLALAEGFQVYLSDEKKLEDKQALMDRGVVVYDGGFSEELLEIEFDWVVKNPGIPQHHPFVQKMAKRHFIVNELEFAQRFVVRWQIGAITGTNGKTTTTSMLGEILKKAKNFGFVAGNIGIPLASVVEANRSKKHGYGAVEVAAFQLVNTKDFHPHVATIVSLAPDHLDVFDTEEDYYNAKWKIVDNLDEDDYFILNIDDPLILKTKKDTIAKVITISVKSEADVMIVDGKVMYQREVLFIPERMNVVGIHNITNAMIAAAMARCMEVKAKTIYKVLHSFMGVEHRIEFVDQVDGVKYYNDSKGTNPQSTKVAIKAFDQPIILLAGGYDKKLGFDDVVAASSNIKDIIVFGQTKDKLKAEFKDAVVVEDLEQAFNKAKQLAKPGDIVCLSPACASYDQYQNYEQRGAHFKALVAALRKND
jgi:UDP-N-acetylmuramoylalanine--D-glutamate ligase